jgi:hypothetical protein
MYLADDSIYQEDREVINHSLFEYDVTLFEYQVMIMSKIKGCYLNEINK